MTSLIPNFAWQTLRPIIKVGALHGIIEVPIFSAPSGPSNYSRDFFGAYYDGTATAPAGLFGYDAVTYEAWVKPRPGYRTNPAYLIRAASSTCSLRLNEDLTIGFLIRRVVDGAATVLTTTEKVSIDEWNHVAGTWDGTTMKVYINGVLSVITEALGAGTTFGSPGTVFRLLDYFNSASSSSTLANEVRIWNVARTQEQIIAAMNYTRDVSGTVDVGLQGYWTFQEGSGDTVSNEIVANAFTLTFMSYGSPTSAGWINESYPYRLGTSFCAGRFPIDTSGKIFSIRIPLRKPYSTVNFIPCIMWVDTDGVTVYRYKLWDNVNGFNDYGIIPAYNNQRIPDGAFLEIWNSDGEDSVDLTTSFNLITSILHTVIESDVTTQTEDAELTIDTSLAQEFPLTFPMTFQSQQTYIA